MGQPDRLRSRRARRRIELVEREPLWARVVGEVLFRGEDLLDEHGAMLVSIVATLLLLAAIIVPAFFIDAPVDIVD